MFEVVDHLQHLESLLTRNLLRVTRVGDGFVLVVLENYRTQLAVGHVLDVQPLHRELTLPLALCPHVRGVAEVHRRSHQSHPAKVSCTIDAEEEIDACIFSLALEGSVESLVAHFSAAPN